MCELFAMSALFPTTVRLSLDVLARHGGGSVPLSDERWEPLAEGELVVLRNGRALRGNAPLAPALQ